MLSTNHELRIVVLVAAFSITGCDSFNRHYMESKPHINPGLRWLDEAETEGDCKIRRVDCIDNAYGSEAAIALCRERANECIARTRSGGPRPAARSTPSEGASDSQELQDALGQLGAAIGNYQDSRSRRQGKESAKAQTSTPNQDIQSQTQGGQPGEPVHGCLVPVQEGVGGFANTCSFIVNFGFCTIKPRSDAWATVWDCARATNLSNYRNIKANSKQVLQNRAAESVTWFACKDPAIPMEMRFDGSRIIGFCRTP